MKVLWFWIALAMMISEVRAAPIPFSGELLWKPSPVEEQIISAIAQGIERAVREQHSKTGKAVRDAHAKQHGCVLADFQILPGLDRVGLNQSIFSVPGKTYEAVIRYSNGSGDPDSDDRIPGARGMAIKLMGVGGEKLLDDESETQDFPMIDYPAFFVKSVTDYAVFMKDPRAFFATHAEEGQVFAALGDPVTRAPKSLLESSYFSMTPRQFGPVSQLSPVKYSVKPVSCAEGEPLPAALPLEDNANALRLALEKSLLQSDACFEFRIQRFVDENVTPVNNPVKVWDENVSKPIAVAKIIVKKQGFNTARRELLCEDLSISPWHSVPELQPLGGIEATRRVVYQAISKLRHTLNGRAPKEPRGFQDF